MNKQIPIYILYIVALLISYKSYSTSFINDSNILDFYIFEKDNLFSDVSMFFLINLPLMFMLNYNVLLYKLNYLDESINYLRYRCINRELFIKKIDLHLSRVIIINITICYLSIIIMLLLSNDLDSFVFIKGYILMIYIIIINLLFISFTTIFDSTIICYIFATSLVSIISALQLNAYILCVVVIMTILFYLKRRVRI